VPDSSPPPAARTFFLWAWQPAAAKPTGKNILRTTEGGEES